MNFNLTPSFKAIRYFERMTNISFLDLEDKPDFVFHLLYCCLISHPENNFRMTFEAATNEFFPKYAEQLITDFASEMEILNQFTKEIKKENDSSTNDSSTSSPKEKENIFLSSLIPILIMNCHLDPNFVLNDMDYTDTELYLNFSVEKYHQEMEDKRFWTYIQLSPNLSSKSGIKDASDLITFTWEKDKKKEEAERKMKEDRDKLIKYGIIKSDENKEETT